jgi:8-oxo-dGTP pyrophosphatase MutT (NUDIX family)
MRTFDADGFRLRASVVLFSPCFTHVLLVSSSKRPCELVLPGGGVEPGEGAAEAARRELWEEAGALAGAGSLAPLFSGAAVVRKRARTAAFFAVAGAPMGGEAVAYPEAGARRRAWVPLGGAAAALSGSAVGAAVWEGAVAALGVPDLSDAGAVGAAVRALAAAAAAAAKAVV